MRISKQQFKKLIRNPELFSIDDEACLKNLPSRYWVYDDLLADLKRAGWRRFAPGFKAGVYGHPEKEYCIKILGMGVGENPLYFCERGYYLEHERNMLWSFRDQGFNFMPLPLLPKESVHFLIHKCGVNPIQAEMRVNKNDVLIMEYIPGIPFATQTGHHLNYDINIDIFDDELLDEAIYALIKLQHNLNVANTKGLVHNDPMPPNIIFTINEKDEIEAKLVDLELAQNLHIPSPDYVNNTVSELYVDRDVPFNSQNHRYTRNLDQHLLDASIGVMKKIKDEFSYAHKSGIGWEDWTININIPFVAGIGITLGSINNIVRKTLYCLFNGQI